MTGTPDLTLVEAEKRRAAVAAIRTQIEALMADIKDGRIEPAVARTKLFALMQEFGVAASAFETAVAALPSKGGRA